MFPIFDSRVTKRHANIISVVGPMGSAGKSLVSACLGKMRLRPQANAERGTDLQATSALQPVTGVAVHRNADDSVATSGSLSASP